MCEVAMDFEISKSSIDHQEYILCIVKEVYKFKLI